MNAHRNRSILLWLAALAILWGVLAPTLAPTLASTMAQHSGKTWIEVCMSVGTRLVAMDSDRAADEQAVHPGMHCQACVSQYDLAVVAHPPGRLVVVKASVERSVGFHQLLLPHAADYRSAHRSRAPPRLS